jgi:hypothetical protein
MYNKVTYLVICVLAIGQISYARLVAQWDLEEGSGTTTTAAVGSPQANGTLVGATWITTGLAPIGGNTAAVFFNSANADRVETNYPGVLGQAARSVTAWIRAEPVQANSSVMVGWGANNATERYSFRLNKTAADGAMYALRLEIQGSRVVATTPVNDGQWHHIAATHGDGALINQVTFYVDGRLDAQSGTSGGGLINTASTSVVLGNSGHNTATYGYSGAIDDVRIYDHALSDVEILGVMKGQPWPYASGPVPPDGDLHEDTWINLSWRPGVFAISHDVYLGDGFDNVSNATPESETFRGNQTATSFLAGFPGHPYPEGLVPGTTYYWRIDEVNDADPNSPWKGPLWSFSIPPNTAYNPNPADGAESVGPDNVTLSWTPGFGAKLHTVYFGDDFDVVSNATGGSSQGTATFKPASLQSEKVYYWRVDEFDGASTYKGNIWAFTTPGAAGNPRPANGATGVQVTTKLSWTPATNAASHQIYFGTDKGAVRNATAGSPEYKGNRPFGSEDYDPGKLAWYTPYYWRVDAVYNTGTVKGLVWSFTTADFLLVDDFESYNDLDPPDPASNRIFDAWIDGFAAPTTNGALVGNDLPPYAERTVVHGGAQSMPYSYDNNLKTSEATLTLVYPRDWTEEGVGQLSLWFRGASANAAERMYVALNGGMPVYHTNPKAAQAAGWTEWVIGLQTFQCVTLTNVNTISIGFGTEGSPAAGGTGKVYFDDVRLYRPRTP